MSLSRLGEDGEYFEIKPGYTYITPSGRFNTGIHDPKQFCELAMRALAQSGRLDDDTLERCEQAFRERFRFTFEDND